MKGILQYYILTEKRSVFSVGVTTNELEDVRTGWVQEGDDSTSQSGPVDPRIMLIGENRQETKTNNNGTGDIALVLLVLNVTNSSRSQEENSKDGQDADPDRRSVLLDGGESLKEVDNSREDNPTVP